MGLLVRCNNALPKRSRQEKNRQMLPTQKPCCTCKIVKPLSDFYKDKGQKDGHEHRCKVCRKVSVVRHERAHKEKANLRKKRWAEKNVDKRRESERRSYLKLSKINPGRYRSKCRARQALIKKATPAWASKYKIEAVYNSCPKGFHVDHIIPLKSDLVCGLHVETNLQIITEFQNCSKNNRVDLFKISEVFLSELQKQKAQDFS